MGNSSYDGPNFSNNGFNSTFGGSNQFGSSSLGGLGYNPNSLMSSSGNIEFSFNMITFRNKNYITT